LVTEPELRVAADAAISATWAVGDDEPGFLAAHAACFVASAPGGADSIGIASSTASSPVLRSLQAVLLRDIYGPLLYRDVRWEPGWLTRNGGTVKRLAEGIYQERALPSGHLDSARLAVLADALEEAGCNNGEILAHCREQGKIHVRGCWVIELLLQKG
jgi:hypothetical protein